MGTPAVAFRLGARLSRAYILAHLGQYDKAIAECQELLKEYAKPKEMRDIRIRFSSIYGLAHDPGRSEEQRLASLA